MTDELDKRSAHSFKHTSKSKTSLSTIAEETKSHVTDAVTEGSQRLPSTSGSSDEAIEPIRSSTSLMVERKIQERHLPKREIGTRSIGSISSKRSTKEDKKWDLYHAKTLHSEPLFPTVVPDDDKSIKSLEPSFLVTGFGMRNLASLQNALQEQEKRLKALFKPSKESLPKEPTESQKSIKTEMAAQSVSTSTSGSTVSVASSFEKQKLEYLMGLQTITMEEEHEEEKLDYQQVLEEESIEEPITGTTIAMRQAQKYLRVHKIFEFFQFLISHMLSAIPDNPIEFLIEMLDKCLLYRAGYCEAPLLYTKPHIEQLFYLMDRMRTGFIDFEQYKTGMITLGICSYNKKPPMNIGGLITKEFFTEEAYECLINQLDDMVRRWKGAEHPMTAVPPPSPISTCYPGSLVPHPTPFSHLSLSCQEEG